jgi:hypothetical protein
VIFILPLAFERYISSPRILVNLIMIIMSDRWKLELGNERFVCVCVWTEDVRVDVREYQHYNCHAPTFPMKKGVSLPMGQWTILVDSTDSIDEAIDHGRAYIRHLGGNVYCKVAEHGVCIDIRQYWKPLGQDDVDPIKRGKSLRPEDYTTLKDIKPEIGVVIPELNGVVPCYIHHHNQGGLLRCAKCNPNGCD